MDLSLYLVTGRELLPPGKEYLQHLEEALQGGVSVVQIREKNAETLDFLNIARQSKALAARYNVPLLINDRIDIALASGADGVHLGQTDMPIAVARQLLPKGAIVGLSCNTVKDVEQSVADGADYVGIGSVYSTSTKKLTSPVIGVRNVGALLKVLDGTGIKAVAIGGIKSSNLLRTLHGTKSDTGRALDGVAIVSDIFASPNPRQAAEKLAGTIRAFKQQQALELATYDSDSLLDGVLELMKSTRSLNPLVHQITNNVVSTQSANLTIALGASPIMATAPQEMEDLARVCSALLVNIGTLTDATLQGMSLAGLHANLHQRPIIFDPVGVGATEYRKEATRNLLNIWQASVIKGNAAELAALSGSTEVSSKGVDSVGSGFRDPREFVKTLAKKENCVVLLTGPTDYLSDGRHVVELTNGNLMLSQITGSGCMLGSAVATYCAALPQPLPGQLVSRDILLGAVTGVLMLTIAAELAIERKPVTGPGTFLPALLDAAASLSLSPADVKRLAKIAVF
ncbi:thiamine biosynthetic bifunctional enzyme Thi4 [Mycena floridula]|nr:thiamine biosynthetic bifunctional enzyme Thi4 [Mycena floridula]